MQLTKVDDTLQEITDKKVCEFLFVQVGKKRKMEATDALIVRGQEDSGLHHQLNPREIKIDDDKFTNSLKKC